MKRQTEVARFFGKLHERIATVYNSSLGLFCLGCLLCFVVVLTEHSRDRLKPSLNLGIKGIATTWCFLSGPQSRLDDDLSSLGRMT